VARGRESLVEQATRILPCAPDAVEWRVDRFDAVCDTEAVLDALNVLRETITDIPLVFTCRDIREGGFQEIEQADRLRLNLSVIASGQADLVDVEISNGEAMIGEVKKAGLRTGTKLILSYHNFNETPGEDFILERLSAARDLGGDVAKVAVMPKNYKDVLTLLGATYRARTEYLDIPMITISMGVEGAISRIAGGLFGSDLTFAVGFAASAPGQISIVDLRNAWKALPMNPCLTTIEHWEK
jgi:3-dehydroquinate dehydratase-1